MKLVVDDAVCSGHGRCYRLAPDILSYDEEGYVAGRGEPIDFPGERRELAVEIVGTCPEQAILLIDD
ncbi:MAG TPA: ferredoxin [Solirubrobacteraceae bacterium]|nr:ferredoxin [Solirubrobacteraceae bacterium]